MAQNTRAYINDKRKRVKHSRYEEFVFKRPGERVFRVVWSIPSDDILIHGWRLWRWLERFFAFWLQRTILVIFVMILCLRRSSIVVWRSVNALLACRSVHGTWFARTPHPTWLKSTWLLNSRKAKFWECSSLNVPKSYSSYTEKRFRVWKNEAEIPSCQGSTASLLLSNFAARPPNWNKGHPQIGVYLHAGYKRSVHDPPGLARPSLRSADRPRVSAPHQVPNMHFVTISSRLAVRHKVNDSGYSRLSALWNFYFDYKALGNWLQCIPVH